MTTHSKSPNTNNEEVKEFSRLFNEAFNELHEVVLNASNTLGYIFNPRYDYPSMSLTQTNFPIFTETRPYIDQEPPLNYVDTVRPTGLAAIIAGRTQPPLPKTNALFNFSCSSKIGNRLRIIHGENSSIQPLSVEHLVHSAVERYIHQYGINTPVDEIRRSRVVTPLIRALTEHTHNLRLIVPIALTKFDVTYLKLTDSSYLIQIPKRLQLARARLSLFDSTAVKNVVGAATHAFVSTRWTVSSTTLFELPMLLSQIPPNVIDVIDSFFGALRIATGIDTGYAQILWMPTNWTTDYYCDLPKVFGTTLRRYPEKFDNYAWAERGSLVSVEQLNSIKTVYKSVLADHTQGVHLAIKRLNTCLTRNDPVDAILDGTIGLEILLGDKENQSLSYKLRLRAAALAMLQNDQQFPAREVFAQMNRIYTLRSKIVHGNKATGTRSATEPPKQKYENERLIAANLLRFTLTALLANPKYQDPSRIDDGLLLRGDDNPMSAR